MVFITIIRADKLPAGFAESYFDELVSGSKWPGFNFLSGKKLKIFIDEIKDVLFNPEKEIKRVSLDSESDLLRSSYNNYYKDVEQAEA